MHLIDWYARATALRTQFIGVKDSGGGGAKPEESRTDSLLSSIGNLEIGI